ncbi:MAG: hypothetical protein LBR35_00025, partial [Rickettsiales bacterium]|nr:hypothetical protein [Rickettsiales bacterium]
MTILTYTQSSFLNGELSSGYVSRNDMSARSNGLAVLQNAHTTPDGGIRRRPGLKYVSSLSSTGRLFSYTLKSNDIYLLVLCQRKMEIYKNDELITTLITPYTADQINQIQTSQNIDEMIFTHVNHAPRTLSFDKNDGFIFKLVSWTKDSDGAELHPYFKFPDTKDVSLTPSAGTGEIILSANKEIFNNSFMNMTLKINDGVVRILNIQNPKTARALVLKTISTLTASSSYYEPAFSDIRGYPKTSCFHQGRLIFAG